MGTTAEKLQAVVDAKADIGAAITEKGGTVPRRFSEYGAAIRALPSGEENEPLTPLDAKKVYALMRDANWPPMPQDIPDHTLVFLFAGEGSAEFIAVCDGDYTVETKLCTLVDGAWTYTVESTETLATNTAFTKVIPAAETTEYRLITVSADTPIIGFSMHAVDGDRKMRGCVEVLFRLPSMEEPKFGSMTDLQFATNLGTPYGTSHTSTFSGCSSLICYIGPDQPMDGSITSFFHGCEQLLAANIMLSPLTSHVATRTFMGCERLTASPLSCVDIGVGTFTYLYSGCTSLTSVKLRTAVPVVGLASAFNMCVSLRSISITGTANGLSMGSAFKGCISLKSLTFDLPNWDGTNFSIAGCAFERSGLVEMFESLPVISTNKSINITGNPGVADLTEEDKAIATAKNWTLII